MSLNTRTVRLAGESGDAQLVFSGPNLVAIISELSAEYEADAGRWFIEAGFGPIANHPTSTFAKMSEALDWMSTALQNTNQPVLSAI